MKAGNSHTNKSRAKWALVLACFLLVAIVILLMFNTLVSSSRSVDRAKYSDLQAQSAANMASIVERLNEYTRDGGRFPDPDGWEQSLIAGGIVSADWFEPRVSEERGIRPAYFLVPPDTMNLNTGDVSAIVLYEHPDLFEGGGHLAYVNAEVRFIEEPDFSKVIAAFRDSQGNVFAPHLVPASAAP